VRAIDPQPSLGHVLIKPPWLLSGVKQTCAGALQTFAFDPTRTQATSCLLRCIYPLIIGSAPNPAGDLRYGLGCNMEIGVGVFVERSLRVLAQAPYQVDETLVDNVVSEDRCKERSVRILAWSSFSSAGRFTHC